MQLGVNTVKPFILTAMQFKSSCDSIVTLLPHWNYCLCVKILIHVQDLTFIKKFLQFQPDVQQKFLVSCKLLNFC